MSSLPVVKAREMAAVLKRAGFHELRQVGSHLTFKHPKGSMVVVPMHSKDLPRPMTTAILKQAGLSDEEFLKLL